MISKILRTILAVLMFALPFAIRFTYYNRGTYQKNQLVELPNYEELSLPQPNLSTPSAKTISQPAVSASVLIDFIHGNYFKITEIDPLTKIFRDMDIPYTITNDTDTLEDQLRQVSAFIVIAPTSPFTKIELQVIQQFIDRGGRLLVIADPTRYIDPTETFFYSAPVVAIVYSVDICNQLLAPYQIKFNQDYLYNVVRNEGNFRNVIFNQFAKSPITKNMQEVVLYSAHSIQTEANGLLFGDENTLSSLTDQNENFTAAALSENGNVLALGDLSFMTVPYSQISDNQILIQNIAEFLAGGSPTPNLTTLPFLFSRPVILYHPTDTVMDANTLNAFARIKATLDRFSAAVEISGTIQPDKDVIFLAVYPPSKEVEPYLEKFGIEFSNEPIPTQSSIKSKFTATPTTVGSNGQKEPGSQYQKPTEKRQDVVIIPGLGKFPIAGTGLILFNPGEKQSILTLMAESPEALTELTALVFSDYPDLSGCLIQNNLAACRLFTVSSNSEYEYDYGDYTYENYDYLTQTPATTETPFIELTPTPSG